MGHILDGILKSRFSQAEIEKLKRGVEQINPCRLSTSALHTKLILAQKSQDPIFYAVQNAMPSACLILVYYEDENKQTSHWTGSGFLIDNNLIITSAHVLPPQNGEAVIKVSFDGTNNVPATSVYANSSLDIGILQVENTNVVPSKIAQNAPMPGEEIAVIGAPEGWSNVVTVGRVSAVNKTPAKLPEQSWQDMIFIDADIYEGSSGSMVINTNGEVIGVVMGIIGKHAAEQNTGQNAVVPIQRVLSEIQK